MTDSIPNTPEPLWVTEEHDVLRLARRVVDTGRSVPIVCLTTQPYLRQPMLDAEAVYRELERRAEVWVVTNAQHAWALTERLPSGLDVYGGAARVWWPIKDVATVNPHDHPIFTIFNPEDAPRVVDQIATHVRRRLTPAPATGLETTGVVTAALEHGAEIMLVSGHVAFAANAHLANGPIYKAWQAVHEGQPVRVRVSGAPPPGRHAYPVSLRPFAPKPWERLAEVYEVGQVVEGVVVELRNFGAFVELLPGAKGLLPNKRISREYVLHPEDFLELEERVIVKLRSLDPSEEKAELSLIEVPQNAAVEPPASVYPDGPPWLLPDIAEPRLDPADLTLGRPEGPSYLLTPLTASDATPASAGPEPEISSPVDADIDDRAPADQEAPPEDSDGSGTDTDAADLTGDEVGGDAIPAVDEDPAVAVELRAAIEEAHAVHERLSTAGGIAESELARLRAKARQLITDLRQEITDAELRVLRLGAGTGEIVRATQHEFHALQEHVGELGERLLAAERDREALIQRTRVLSERADSQSKRLVVAHGEAARAEQQAAALRRELDHVDGGDPVLRFARELHLAWLRLYESEHDRGRFPFNQPIIGPAFLKSIDETEGVSRGRVLEVCAHVVSGRASEINSLEMHQLRTNAGGDAPVRVRDDGATAWRVSLQVKTASARRLHFWLLKNGRIELSKVGVHDDLSIV